METTQTNANIQKIIVKIIAINSPTDNFFILICSTNKRAGRYKNLWALNNNSLAIRQREIHCASTIQLNKLLCNSFNSEKK